MKSLRLLLSRKSKETVMKKQYLMTPGPTPVPEEVLLHMAKPIIHHRTPDFRNIIKEVEDGLKLVFQTKNEVLIFASSGTGAMEAAVANMLSPGDSAIAVSGGKFGERWSELCQAYGVNVTTIDVEWGKAADPKDIEKQLKPGVKAVFTTLCETSTGVTNDIEAIAKVVAKTDAVLVVDAISGLGACQLKTDAWKVDVVVSGSQKGLMIPPGLAFVSVSKKAWGLAEASKSTKYYFDFLKYKKSLEKTDTPYTPAITLMIGLNKALEMIKSEGIDAVLKRHSILANATRKAIDALGLKLLAPDAPSDAVTAVKVPDGIDGQELVKILKEKYGVWFAGGQADLKGKIFRVAHMGYMNRFDLMVGISALEMALLELGYKFSPGVGLTAAIKALEG